MPVNIRTNEKYVRIVKSLMRKNVSGEKHVAGIFSTLAKWRKPMPDEDGIELHRIFATHSQMRERREHIESIWKDILSKMPMPRYPN